MTIFKSMTCVMSSMMIELTTADNVKIKADHYKIDLPSPGISLFHMMPATKRTWRWLAEKINDAGIGVLAIDLRGHGVSEGGPEGYLEFTKEEHAKYFEDVKAAVAYQKKEGHSPLFVGGGSVGASLSLKAVAEIPEVTKAIILSAGLNYIGIDALSIAARIDKDKEVYIVAADDDERSLGSAGEQARKIFAALSCKKKLKVFETGGHGTRILKNHPEFMEELATWLKGNNL